MRELEGKIALVTGASRGIGREIALRLAGAGAAVWCAARTEEGAAETARAIESGGGKAFALAMDVSDPASVEEGCRRIAEADGSVQIVVNNAGITRDNLILRMKPEEWESVISTNLAGVYRVCRALAPTLVRQRFGRIVNVTSVVARIGNPGQANYAAAKAGIEGMSRSLARELASRNVTVNCVAPGFIDTDMTRELPEESRKKLLDQVPLKRLGTPADVAAAVLFLVGEGASYVTGAVLDVNGGMYM